MNSRGSSLLLSIAFAAVLVLGLIAERIAGAGTALTAIVVVRTVLLLGIIVLGAARMAQAQGERKVLWRWAVLCYVVGFAGLLLFTAQSELGTRLLGTPLSQSSPKLAVTFQVLFPALLILSLVPRRWCARRCSRRTGPGARSSLAWGRPSSSSSPSRPCTWPRSGT
jgi:hypothetical protein